MPAIHAALLVLLRSFFVTNAASEATCFPRATISDCETLAIMLLLLSSFLGFRLSGSETPPLRAWDAIDEEHSLYSLLVAFETRVLVVLAFLQSEGNLVNIECGRPNLKTAMINAKPILPSPNFIMINFYFIFSLLRQIGSLEPNPHDPISLCKYVCKDPCSYL